jgi:hypothetical protein
LAPADEVQVKGQVTRRRLEGRDDLVEEHVPQSLEGGDGDGVLAAQQGGLAGQVEVLRGAVGEELEDGVGAEGVVVLLVRVAGEDAVDAAAHHLQERVLREGRVAGSSSASAKVRVRPIRWSNWRTGEQPGVAGELAWRRLDDKRGAEKVVDLWPGRW